MGKKFEHFHPALDAVNVASAVIRVHYLFADWGGNIRHRKAIFVASLAMPIDFPENLGRQTIDEVDLIYVVVRRGWDYSINLITIRYFHSIIFFGWRAYCVHSHFFRVLFVWLRIVTAIVEYNYTACEDDELTLEKGAIIKSIKQKPGGWWEGVLASTGKRGMFPDNFVRILSGDDKSPVVLR